MTIRELILNLEDEDIDREITVIHNGKMYGVSDEILCLDGGGFFAFVVGESKGKCRFQVLGMMRE